MLRLQKVLQVKTHMRGILESSRLRLSKEFGADNKALEHVRTSFAVTVDFIYLNAATVVKEDFSNLLKLSEIFLHVLYSSQQ